MADSVSIVMKMNEDITGKLKSISSAAGGVSKEFEEQQRKVQQLAQRYDAFNKKAADTYTEAVSLQKTIRETADAFRKTGDASKQADLSKLREQYNSLTDSAKTYSAQAKATMKDIQAVYETIRKQSDMTEPSGGTGGSAISRIFGEGLGAGLAQAGILRDLGGSISNLTGTMIESAAGQPLAAALSGTLSGTVSGIAAGAIAGVPGMIAGGLLGTLSGGINAGNAYYEQKDQAFKAYVQDAYEAQTAAQSSALNSGSATAGTREQTQMAFAQKLGGDAEATAYLGRVKEMAKSTNYTYDEITGYSKLLLNTYDTEKTLSVLQTLSDASAGLNLNSSDVNMFISGLSRMRTTGKTTQEYLDYFTERGVDVYQALANSIGADKSSIAEMVTGGKIAGADAAEAILTYINEIYGGLSEKLSTTYDAMVDNLGDYQADLDAAMGEGYNEGRKVGLQAQMDWMSGESGEALEEANRAIGAWKAELENQKEQYVRDAMDAMMASDEYQTAKAEGDAAEMGKLIMQAKVQGMNEYNASEGAQLALESERALADAIREDAAGNEAYWNAGLEKGNWFTKGLASALGETAFDGVTGNTSLLEDQQAWMQAYRSHAYGLRRVPYDGYPALLHEGERVLTAAEARNGSGGAVVVQVSGNEFVVRGEADIDAIARQIAVRVREARDTYGG